MAAPERQDPIAEPDASEKPVREQLKKASISTASGNVNKTSEESAQEMEHTVENGDGEANASARGRLQKKRSLEDVEDGVQQKQETSSVRPHTRKRSRGSSAEEDDLDDRQRKSVDLRRDAKEATGESSNGHATAPSEVDRPRTPEQTGEKRIDAAVEQMTSPKTKRSRLHAATNGEEVVATTGDVDTTEKKDDSSTKPKDASKIPPTSGFANTSPASPFAGLSGSKSPSAEAQTSANAFAASGFSALTGTSSGFGAIGKNSGGFGSGSGFATGGKSSLSIDDKSTSLEVKGDGKSTAGTESNPGSTFGGALGQQSAFSAPSSQVSASGFGSGASAFGKLGGSSGFGSSFGGGGFGGISGRTGGLASFASGKPSSSLLGSSKPVKPFGAPAHEDEEEGAADEDTEDRDESGIKSPLSQESDKQDERFYEQELETGEEDEVTEYSCRAKLFHFHEKKEWKERGLGVVRLNVKKPGPAEEDPVKPKARLLMRADGSHRVILNTPIKKGIVFGSPQGETPQAGLLYFMGTVDGVPNLAQLLLKVRPQFSTELSEKIGELQDAM